MKIAFFTDTYLPNMDGVVTSILNLKMYFEKKGMMFMYSLREQKKTKNIILTKKCFIIQAFVSRHIQIIR